MDEKGKEFFITGLIPRGQRTRDQVKMSPEASALEEKTTHIFEEAKKIGQGSPIPSVVQTKDQVLLTQLKTVLGATPKQPQGRPPQSNKP